MFRILQKLSSLTCMEFPKNGHDIVAEVSNVSKKPLPILKKIADTRRLERSIECYWYFAKFEQLQLDVQLTFSDSDHLPKYHQQVHQVG